MVRKPQKKNVDNNGEEPEGNERQRKCDNFQDRLQKRIDKRQNDPSEDKVFGGSRQIEAV